MYVCMGSHFQVHITSEFFFSGAIMITSMSLAVLESTVPLWIMDNMEAKQWQLGKSRSLIL